MQGCVCVCMRAFASHVSVRSHLWLKLFSAPLTFWPVPSDAACGADPCPRRFSAWGSAKASERRLLLHVRRVHTLLWAQRRRTVAAGTVAARLKSSTAAATASASRCSSAVDTHRASTVDSKHSCANAATGASNCSRSTGGHLDNCAGAAPAASATGHQCSRAQSSSARSSSSATTTISTTT